MVRGYMPTCTAKMVTTICLSCLSAQANIQWDFANSVDTIGFFQTPQFSCASMTQRAKVIIDCWLTLRTVVSLADEAVEQTTGCLA